MIDHGFQSSQADGLMIIQNKGCSYGLFTWYSDSSHILIASFLKSLFDLYNFDISGADVGIKSFSRWVLHTKSHTSSSGLGI